MKENSIEQIEANREINRNILKHNNMLFNITLDSKPNSNVIDYESRKQTFKKDKFEKDTIKKIKHELKSKTFFTVPKMEAQRSALIESIIHQKPSFNCKLKIL